MRTRSAYPVRSSSGSRVPAAALLAVALALPACGGSSPRPAPAPAEDGPECVVAEGAHVVGIGPADFGSTPDARHVAAFAAGATMLSLGVDSLHSGLIDACAQIGVAAGLSEQELAAGATDSVEGLQRVCRRAAARARSELDALRSAGATVEVRAGDLLDQASLGTFGGCVAACDPSFRSSGETVACDGVARGTCQGGTCEGRCRRFLESAGPCEGTCIGSCAGTCTPAAEPGSCEGRCEGACEGECVAETAGACEGECVGACAGRWESDVACRGTPRVRTAADTACVASCVAYSSVMRDHPDGTPGALRVTGAPAAAAARVQALTQPVSDNLTRLGYTRATLRLQLAATAALLEANPPLASTARGVSELGRRCDGSTRELAIRARARRQAILAIVEEVLAALGSGA